MGDRLSLHERLTLVYERLDALPTASTAEGAYRNLAHTLNEVEDEHSGIPFNPDAGLAYDGRMYPPREDYITRHRDGTLTALTKGQAITAHRNGALTITSRRTERTVYHRPGTA